MIKELIQKALGASSFMDIIPLNLQIKQYYISHGYAWDEINLFGIRNIDNPASNRFDDLLCIVTDSYIKVYGGTTDPGTHWTQENKDKYGIKDDVHVCLGFYKDAYQIGTHRGYRALVQSGNKVNWFKDKNNNGLIDSNEKMQSGYGGLNYHTVGNPEKLRVAVRTNVDFASAGCQVHENQNNFEEVINIVLNTNKYKKNSKACFSYLLVAKEEFPFYAQLLKLKK